jgi:hypothetical protein
MQEFHVDNQGFIVLGEQTFTAPNVNKFSDDLCDGDEKDDITVDASNI